MTHSDMIQAIPHSDGKYQDFSCLNLIGLEYVENVASLCLYQIAAFA
jgi:hypothetical protein